MVSQAANQESGLKWDRCRFHNYLGDPESLKGHLVNGDVLVNSTGTGTLGRIGYFSGSPDEVPCVADGHVTVVRTDPTELHPRFAYYWMRSEVFRDYIFAALVVGATNQIELNRDRLRDAPVPLPLLEEQRRIADFLDAEISRIDRLMKAREKQILLLKDRRWSHFQELIDRSGSPILPLRRIIDSLTDGPFGSAFSSSDYSDEGAAVVRLGNIGFAEYRTDDQARVPMSIFERFQQYAVQAGDVLIAGLGDAKNHAGRACVAPDLGLSIVKGKCFRMRLNSQGDPEFIATVLSSPIGASAVEGRGSTRSMINLDVVKSARVPIPSLLAQRRIVEDHAAAWSQMARLVDRGSAQIGLLAERRQALITAAVTGKFDVTTASGRNLTQGV
ncbi:restriction endonuclease subunit S [Nocardia higoensis]|uniref:Restriction endonuclease subunit S n=2 Tax=Nocardia higoensis TaxID=228599 RepID=A0ABS0D567_9NOCA|nr:restriction endonuclease subunit S [Nocardia higoensis]